jgi:hypothetical protein
MNFSATVFIVKPQMKVVGVQGYSVAALSVKTIDFAAAPVSHRERVRDRAVYNDWPLESQDPTLQR